MLNEIIGTYLGYSKKKNMENFLFLLIGILQSRACFRWIRSNDSRRPQFKFLEQVSRREWFRSFRSSNDDNLFREFSLYIDFIFYLKVFSFGLIGFCACTFAFRRTTLVAVRIQRMRIPPEWKERPYVCRYRLLISLGYCTGRRLLIRIEMCPPGASVCPIVPPPPSTFETRFRAVRRRRIKGHGPPRVRRAV